MNTAAPKPPAIKKRERDAIMASLGSGVVPRIGLHHLQVGRKGEVEAVLDDIRRIQDGGASCRFVVGPFGSGKTFFLQLAKTVAAEQKMVVAHADFTPDRRLAGSGGEARSLYQELVRNLTTKTRPDGGALGGIVERWLSEAGCGDRPTANDIRGKLRSLEEFVGGHDFATVLSVYASAIADGNAERQSSALRWLRGEFTTRTDAKADLGVRGIIDDAEMYDYLKLWAAFVRLAGYSGLMVVLDEAINLYKVRHPVARERNYETILRIFNDCLQGGATGLYVLFGGTPEFLRDQRRGLASYGALRTRLTQNTYATGANRDLRGPVLELPPLTLEELFVLLRNVRRIHAGEGEADRFLPDAGLQAFMQDCNRVLGSSFFLTPRDSVVKFVQLLNLLEQNPGLDWKDPLSKAVSQAESATKQSCQLESAPPEDDVLTGFTV